MASLLKLSTAVTLKFGPFVSQSDGVTEITTTALAAADIQIAKNGNAFGNKNDATAPTLDAEGWYNVTLDATDTNALGHLVVKAHDAATHLPVWERFLVVPANVYDSLVAGSDTLNTDPTALDGDTAALDRLVNSAGSIVLFTVQTGATTTVIPTDLTEATNDHYNGRRVVFITGALANQATDCTDYDGATGDVTVTALTEAPAPGDTGILV